MRTRGIAWESLVGKRPRHILAFLVALLAAATSVPIAVLGHECAHVLVGWAVHVPGMTLHAQSATFTHEEEFWRLVYAGNLQAAAHLYPLFSIAILVSAGPLFSVCVVGLAAYFRRWLGPNFLTAGLATVSTFRLFAPLHVLVVNSIRWVQSRPLLGDSGSDEFRLYLLTAVPLTAQTVIEFLICIVGLWCIYKQMFRQKSYAGTITLAVGVLGGMVLFFS